MADRFRTETNTQMMRAFDPFHHALTIIDEEHRLTHDGMVFYFQRSELDVPDGASRSTLFRTGDATPHFKRIFVQASEGPVIVELYEDAVVDTLGVEIPILNANRRSTKIPDATYYDSTTTFTSPGNPLLGSLYIPQNGNQGVSGGTEVLTELVLKPNTDYHLFLQNDPAGAGTADIVAQVVFYELSYDTP